jgi:hypothetical protein
MKIRTGFVSNSSSSSFIVIFDKKPKSKEEVKKLLFPNKNDDDCLKCYDNSIPIGQITETVFKDLSNSKKVTQKELFALLEHISCKEILKQYKDKWICKLHYADEDDSFGCVMEHGEIFGNLKHFRISHH